MAERIERLRHLIPVGTSITERNTNPRHVPVRFRSPYRSRRTHGTYLCDRLELMRSRAVELGQERLAFGLEADEGICLEFIGETGLSLSYAWHRYAAKTFLTSDHQTKKRGCVTCSSIRCLLRSTHRLS